MAAEIVERVPLAVRKREEALQVLSGDYAGQGLARVLPMEPLAQQVGLAGGWATVRATLDGRRLIRCERAWWRGLEAGYLSWRLADQLAIELLGMHPFQVWGDAWFGL